MGAMEAKNEENNFCDEVTESVPNNMSRLVSFLTALWVSSAAAHPGFSDVANGIKNVVTNEAQASLDPVGKTIAFIGGSVCNNVKPLAGVAYENYDGKEPDMSKLTLVLTNSKMTVIYNLTTAPSVIPQERWYNPQQGMKIYLHGFTDNPQKDSFQTMTAAFAELATTTGEDVNILALDASSLIALFYLRATTMVQYIGELLGAVLAALLPAGLDPAKIHLIGHSLGSHIAGFTGKQFFNLTGHKVGRISGLDPAGPCFGDVPLTMRLNQDDAVFVDVIHTDAGVYGLNEKVGHVDFYPNLGMEQPQCLLQTCSHSRAWEHFAESVVNASAFEAVACSSSDNFRHGKCNTTDTSVMGYHCPAGTTGNYYLVTAGESPYGVGELGLTYSSKGVVRGISYAIKDTLTLIG